MKVQVAAVKVNPLRAVSTLFLIMSPFLTWFTIVSVVVVQGIAVFGTAAQSDLFLVSSQELGTNITSQAALGATITLVTLVLGGLLMLRSAKLGGAVATLGILSYMIPFYPTFGTWVSGLQLTFVSPGIGLFTAMAGVAFGVISFRVTPRPPRVLFDGLRTRRGLSTVGVFVGSVGLVLDFLNHSALGQAADFIGTNLTELALHEGLFVGVTVVSALVLIQPKTRRDYLLPAALATLLLLGVDAGYNITNGTLNDFLGHNVTETVLHFAVYYGMALVIIASFLRKE